MWIHKNKNWTDFKWDSDAISPKLAELRYQQGKLLGKMENLGFEIKQKASLDILTSDVVKSSAIEGENLEATEVRSSIAKKLGIKIAGLNENYNRDVEAIVEVLLDATQNFSKPLTKERLCSWHAALFSTGRSGMHKITVGNWRKDDQGPMQVVSGPIGKENIHFEAPKASKVEKEMQKFLIWLENDQKKTLDPIIKAGIAHLWFVTIHPFDDGNGRIARAITDMLLARADGISDRFYSLSSQIEVERKTYYRELEQQQKASSDITNWLSWFLDCLARSFVSSEHSLSSILIKAELWNQIKQKPVNERQTLIINMMLEEDFKGHINTSKYAKLAKCSNDTALRDIKDLSSRGILIQNAARGRSTSYKLIPAINKQ